MHPDKLYEFNELTTTRALKRSVGTNADQPHGYNKQPKQRKQATLSWSKGSGKRPLLSKENLGRLTLNMVTESLLPMSFVEGKCHFLPMSFVEARGFNGCCQGCNGKG